LHEANWTLGRRLGVRRRTFEFLIEDLMVDWQVGWLVERLQLVWVDYMRRNSTLGVEEVEMSTVLVRILKHGYY